MVCPQVVSFITLYVTASDHPCMLLDPLSAPRSVSLFLFNLTLFLIPRNVTASPTWENSTYVSNFGLDFTFCASEVCYHPTPLPQFKEEFVPLAL